MRCPMCETENADDVWECARCGKAFGAHRVDVDVVEVPGLETTRFDSAGDTFDERVPGLEQTQLVERDLPVMPDSSVQIEATQLETDPRQPPSWTAGPVEIESGRDEPVGERTPPPLEDGTCPRCGEPAAGAVCDHCGMRKSKYTAPPERLQSPMEATDERVLCPACFSKVPPGHRCIECGVPFAVTEI